MKSFFAGQNRRLLFRSYLVIVGGLVVIATVFDLGFRYLQESSMPDPGAWADANLTLIEEHLRPVPAANWQAEALWLSERLGFPVRILADDHVEKPATTSNETIELFDADGRSSFLRKSTALDALLQIGPAPGPAPGDSTPALLVPPLFYLSIFVFVGLWLRPLLRDLNRISEAAREFAGDYRRPIQVLDQTSSLHDLAANLEDMSTRIRNLIQNQKELTSALSHEMRTPLTRIKFAMAVIEDKVDASNELKSIGQDVQEIDDLITTMLNYARLDHQDTKPEFQLLPPDDWLREIVDKFRASHPALTIDCRAPSTLVRMDPYLMELALSNLLVNACRYAQKTVQVSINCSAGRNVLAVEDDGPGIPAAEREQVFRAFTRLDTSRNRSTGGYGLGLAIVTRIAALHGGTAGADESALGGARLLVSWPGGAGPPTD
jgi:signal transduction histidine kinase